MHKLGMLYVHRAFWSDPCVGYASVRCMPHFNSLTAVTRFGGVTMSDTFSRCAENVICVPRNVEATLVSHQHVLWQCIALEP